jgi:Rrf2 family protein
MLTSKAKYALRAMIDPAATGGQRPAFIGDIAACQEIPRRFLENFLLELRKRGLVVSHRGKNGGHALARPPENISFADVIGAMDGPLALAPLCEPHRLPALRGLQGRSDLCDPTRPPRGARRHRPHLERTTLAHAAGGQEKLKALLA